MPDIPVTFGSSLVGRLSCTPEFASMLTDANTQGCRFELSGGYEKRYEENARLVELVVYPVAQQVALTDKEREAIELAAGDYLYHQDPGGRAQHIRQTLLGLLERLG